MITRNAFATGAVIIVLGITGCGGGDDEPESLTQEEFVTQANELCSTFTTDSDASSAAYDEADSSGDLGAAADAYAAIGNQMSDLATGIDELGAPEGQEETVDGMVAAGEELADNAKAGADALRDEDIDGVAETTESAEEIRTRFDQAAGDLGLTECEA